MGIPAGELVLSVAETGVYRGRPVYVVHAHAYTNRAFSIFYSVSDTLTSFMDADGIFSLRYEKDIHETKEETKAVCEYDHESGKWTRNGQPMGELYPYTQDLLSSFYYLRTQEFPPPGETVHVPLNDSKKNYHMLFTMGGRQEMNSHPFKGRIAARSGTPFLQMEDRYKQIGKSDVWFTDDLRRVPVLIRSHILLGTFYAKLVEYIPGRPR